MATALNKPVLDWQLNAHFPDTLDLLSELDAKRYRLQRRLIGPVYLASNVTKFEAAVDGVIKAAVAELRALDGAEVDLKQWMHIIAVECLGAVVLSWSPNYIKNRSDGGTSTQSYLGWKRKSVFGLFPTVTKLSVLSRGLSRLFSNVWGVTFRTPKNFKPFFTVSSHLCLPHERTDQSDSQSTKRRQKESPALSVRQTIQRTSAKICWRI